jgi:CheY-like chemotaxis protein
MLGLLNYDVVETADGTEAIEQFQAARKMGRAFDAVLLDLHVPGGLGGAETLRRLHAIEPKLRAVAMISAHHDDPVLQDCAPHGFAAALSKPFKMQELKPLLAGPREV